MLPILAYHPQDYNFQIGSFHIVAVMVADSLLEAIGKMPLEGFGLSFRVSFVFAVMSAHPVAFVWGQRIAIIDGHITPRDRLVRAEYSDVLHIAPDVSFVGGGVSDCLHVRIIP